MQRQAENQAKPQPGGTEELEIGLEPDPGLHMSDRAAPVWVAPLAWVFSGAMGLCFLGFALIALFLQSLVVEGGEPVLAPILAALAAVPLLALMILEAGQARALAGYRLMREAAMRSAQAGAAIAAFAVLSFLHPALGLAIPLGGGAAAALVWAATRSNAREPLWDFLPSEAVSVLSGRDDTGFALARSTPADPAILPGLLRAVSWGALACGMAIASWLAARGILAPAAVPATGLISLWAVDALARFALARSRANPMQAARAAAVTPLRIPPDPGTGSGTDPETGAGRGLTVSGLRAAAPGAPPLLADIAFDLEPGQMLAIEGPPAAGKSLLMQSLVNPYDRTGLELRGRVRLGDHDLWERSRDPRATPAVLLPARPLILPASGLANLTFFEDGSAELRGRRILESLVFASDTVERICATPDATTLSDGEQKALALARAFLLSPPLMLLDRPEDGVPEKLMGALIARIAQERRAGRAFVVATTHRALLEACDKLLVLSEGRVVDYGPAAELRARQSAGWLRFIGARALETEDNLEAWVRSHFRRDGDEINRRNACVVAAELLAFSCASAPPLSRQTLSFEFRHFEGHCLIRMTDRDMPLSSGALARAREEAAAEMDVGKTDVGKTARALSPLARVVALCATVEPATDGDMRVIEAKLPTYDPRKSGGKPPPGVTAGVTPGTQPQEPKSHDATPA